MDFNIGDRVIHKAYGSGEILQLDEKHVEGKTQTFYIVQTSNLTLWVPVEVEDESVPSLRYVTPPEQFKALFRILGGKAQELPEDRMERKLLLQERLKDGSLDAICRVVRDLHELNKIKKLNDYDTSIMERARGFLVDEWAIAFAIPSQQAEKELQGMLEQQAR